MTAQQRVQQKYPNAEAFCADYRYGHHWMAIRAGSKKLSVDWSSADAAWDEAAKKLAASTRHREKS